MTDKLKQLARETAERIAVEYWGVADGDAKAKSLVREATPIILDALRQCEPQEGCRHARSEWEEFDKDGGMCTHERHDDAPPEPSGFCRACEREQARHKEEIHKLIAHWVDVVKWQGESADARAQAAAVEMRRKCAQIAPSFHEAILGLSVDMNAHDRLVAGAYQDAANLFIGQWHHLGCSLVSEPEEKCDCPHERNGDIAGLICSRTPANAQAALDRAINNALTQQRMEDERTFIPVALHDALLAKAREEGFSAGVASCPGEGLVSEPDEKGRARGAKP